MKNTFSQFNKAFTLAEVLITLVIIGVVAALAISPLINTYVESSTVSKVKKGLSILGQAKKLAEVQNGSIEGWEFDEGSTAETATQFWNYLKPHISVAKDCGTGTNCYINQSIKHLSGTNYSSLNASNFYKVILPDGGMFLFRTGGFAGTGKCSVADGNVKDVCALFFYDVNGAKNPNTIGRDIFLFEFAKEGVYTYLTNDCINTNSLGYGCSSYIIKKSDMKYLH